MTRGHGSALTILAAIVPVLGVILLLTGDNSPPEKFFAINCILGGITQLYITIRMIVKKEETDVSFVFLMTVLFVYQTWILLPIYMHLSERGQQIMRKGYLVILGMFVLLCIGVAVFN